MTLKELELALADIRSKGANDETEVVITRSDPHGYYYYGLESVDEVSYLRCLKDRNRNYRFMEWDQDYNEHQMCIKID